VTFSDDQSSISVFGVFFTVRENMKRCHSYARDTVKYYNCQTLGFIHCTR